MLPRCPNESCSSGQFPLVYLTSLNVTWLLRALMEPVSCRRAAAVLALATQLSEEMLLPGSSRAYLAWRSVYESGVFWARAERGTGIASPRVRCFHIFHRRPTARRDDGQQEVFLRRFQRAVPLVCLKTVSGIEGWCCSPALSICFAGPCGYQSFPVRRPAGTGPPSTAMGYPAESRLIPGATRRPQAGKTTPRQR